jgi:hypothetical protein
MAHGGYAYTETALIDTGFEKIFKTVKIRVVSV